jgi:hypothetical protein
LFAIIFKKFSDIKILLASIVVFLFTFSPLLFFNLKHGGILQGNVEGLLSPGKSFGFSTWQFLIDRLSAIGVNFSSLIFRNPSDKEWLIIFAIFIMFVYFFKKIIKNNRLKVLLIFLGALTAGALFFQGNEGNFYQYYLTGYYLIFLILVSAILNFLFESSFLGKIAVACIIIIFLLENWGFVKSYIYTTGGESDKIVLGNQKQVVDWVYKNANGRNFNVDVYVPPVISYSYDYLFRWLGTTKYQKLPLDNQVPLLYTLYEIDPPHPERLNAWLDRQKGIGKVVKEQSFGGITVQERNRIIKK